MLDLQRWQQRLTIKLAVLVTLAVLSVTLVLGLSFDAFLSATFMDATRTRLAHAYQRLTFGLNRIEAQLQQTATVVASGEPLLASVELVNHYQDKANYNPFLIDEEKKTLAQLLLNHVKLSQNNQLALYDHNDELIAFAHQQGAQLALGYVSFANGKTTVWRRMDDESEFHAALLPDHQGIPLKREPQPVKPKVAVTGELAYLRMGASLMVRWHLQLQDPSGGRHMMSMDLSHVLDASALDTLSKDLGLDIRMVLDHPLASQAQWLDRRDPNEEVRVTDAGDQYLGLMKHDAVGGPVYFAVALDKAKENEAVNSYRLRFALLSLFMALLTLAFMHRVLLRSLVRPLEGLMAQIQRIKQGDYTLLPAVVSGDELEVISRSVNTLAHTVQEREAALERARKEEEYLSKHDVLTGLPNQRFLAERMSHALDLAQRAHSQLAVLFVDLDQFKLVNDTLGHPIGDLLLAKIAERFAASMRVTDTLARIGGDEFNVLIENVHAMAELEVVVGKYLALFTKPFVCGEHHISITASIGVAMYPRDGVDAVTLLKHADLAVYAAKERGRNTSCFYSPELSRLANSRAVMIHDLKVAIDAGDQFELHYQPKVNAMTGRVVAAEALIRWHKPGVGLVPPGSFIGIAEETRQIIPIGDWVIERACQDLQRLQRTGIVLTHLSLNVSNVQLHGHDLQGVLQQALSRHGLDPALLELEMTESYIAQDTQQAIASLQAFRYMGLALSIDDFGTGYSSLSYLKKLPFTRLKIDKSFVDGLPTDPDSVAITRAIVGLAKNFGLALTAEGVERAEQLAFLQAEQCDEIQGYYFARPMPLDEFVAFYQSNRTITLDANLPPNS